MACLTSAAHVTECAAGALCTREALAASGRSLRWSTNTAGSARPAYAADTTRTTRSADSAWSARASYTTGASQSADPARPAGTSYTTEASWSADPADPTCTTGTTWSTNTANPTWPTHTANATESTGTANTASSAHGSGAGRGPHCTAWHGDLGPAGESDWATWRARKVGGPPPRVVRTPTG